MKFGYFDDLNREYVMNTPKTPFPWINYLGQDGFFSLISNTGGATASTRMQGSEGLPDTGTTAFRGIMGEGICMSMTRERFTH